jgi:ferredoxin
MNDFLAINVEPGKTIQDIVEASGSALPFGCRDGECGTCVVSIEQGMEYLSPMTDKEVKVLKEVLIGTVTEKSRLSCQMKVIKPNGLIRIKY